MQEPKRTNRPVDRARLGGTERGVGGPERNGAGASRLVAIRATAAFHPGEDDPSGSERHRSDQTWASRAAASGKVSLEDVARALETLPTTTAVMTAGHEQTRAGMLIHRVMACASEPPMLCVSVRKGHHLASIIRDARCFGVCVIEPTQRLMMRKFAIEPVTTEDAPEQKGDPFDAMQVVRLISTAPILARAVAAMDCEVVRHLDLEADSELYVGQVLAVRLSPQTQAMSGPDVPGRTAGMPAPLLPYDRGRLGA